MSATPLTRRASRNADAYSTHERFLLQSLQRQRMVRFAGDAPVGWSMSPLKRRPDTPSPETRSYRQHPEKNIKQVRSRRNCASALFVARPP